MSLNDFFLEWTHDKNSHYLAERAGWLREWMGQFQGMRSVVVVVTLFGSDENYASQESNTVRMIVDLVSILRRIPTLEIRNDGNFTTPVWAQIVQLAREEVQGEPLESEIVRKANGEIRLTIITAVDEGRR